MNRLVLLSLFLVSVSFSVPGALPRDQTTREAADRFLDTLNRGDFTGLEKLYADDAVFEDPALRVYITGAGTIARFFAEGYAVAEAFGWRVAGGFATGSWVVLHGRFHSRLDGARIGRPGLRPEGTQRFVLALQIVDGRVARHVDFLDYDAWDHANPAVPVPVARRHEPRQRLEALADRFIATLNTWPPSVDEAVDLYTDDLVFEDPTFGLRQEGKASFRAAVVDLWSKTGSVDGRSVTDDRIVSGSFVILRGRYSQKRSPSAAPGDRVSMAFVTVFDVRDGRIARQWDFFDKDALDRQMAGRAWRPAAVS